MGELGEPGEGLPEGPSKSRLKREMRALQALAEQLVGLPRAEMERLSLGAETSAAIEETARIRDLRALRRHYKHIAKLLSREGADAVTALLQEKGDLARRETARHHRVERWRGRLIEEGDAALGEFLDAFPAADRQQLRSLVRAAQRDWERGRPDSARKLFRFLRAALEGAEIG